MIILALLFVTVIRDIQMQPVACIDDVNCNVGFFCHIMTYQCHECLSCESLGRSPASKESSCIKSVNQCGPCLQGFLTYEAKWGAICLSPEAKSIRMLFSYIYILVVAGLLLSLLIAHIIWNTHIINVMIAIPTRKKNLPEQSRNSNDVPETI